MQGNENRLVRKYFKCSNCKLFDSILINPSIQIGKCSKCHSYLKEISESEFKKLKQILKEKKERINNERNYRQNQNNNVINNNIPSHSNNNQNRINQERENNNRQFQRRNSGLHYSRMNINNEDNDYNDNNIYNNNNRNNRNQNSRPNTNNINNNNNHHHGFININFINNNNNRRENNRHHNRRRRDNSSERHTSNNIFHHFLGNMFNPFSNMINPMINNQNINRNPFRIVIQRQNVNHDIFDPTFSLFGSVFNGNFQDNYSSNFRSNYRGNFLEEILRILQPNMQESERRAHPPTSKENLNKLKQFNMNEKYCKKENNKVELPNCCICLDEIALGEKSTLLPCGHMFHSNCILTWLKKNNTCPMCRFEIK